MPAACQSLPASPCIPLAVPAFAIPQTRPRSRHPRGFYLLCAVVACERWAAYTLSALAVLMISERFGYSRADALRLVSLMSAACYLGTLPGGMLIDRVLGCRRAVAVSVVLLGLGYAGLIRSSPLAFFLSLTLLVIGSALFKPSTQSVLARLYIAGDARLETAQTWFYMAVNAGAAAGALVAGLIARKGGWGAPFALASAVMLTAWILLSWFRADLPLGPLVQQPRSSSASPMQVRYETWTIAALILALLVYTVCYGQVEGSLLLWAQDRTDRMLLGFEVPAAWFVALPALLVLVLGPVQLALLPWLQRRIGTHKLVAVGLLSAALAFVVLLLASATSTAQQVSMLWLVGAMTLLVVGELLVAPLGIALILRLTPPQHCGMVVGIWYLSGAIGFWLAGEIGAWASRGLPGLTVLALLPVVGAMALLVSHPRDLSATSS